MDRRSFLKNSTLASGAIATAGIAAPAVAQSKKQWIAVSAFGKAGLLGQALESFASSVGTLTGGSLTIDVYHAGELVAPFEALDAVQAGTAQMGFGAPYYWAGKSDSISFVACMPFGLNAQEQNAWCYYGGGIELADKTAYNPLGLKFLPMGNTGNQMGGWYNKEVTTVADLQGLKFRMPGLGGEILKTFGVNVINLPGSEVLAALTSGAIDGTEWIGPAADLGSGLYKVCKNYYYPGWHEPATILDSFFDQREYEGLSEDLRTAVEYAAAQTNLMVLSRFQAANNSALQKLINEHSVNLAPYSDELISAIGERATSVIPELASKDSNATELYNNLVTFRKTMVEWSGYSEGNFMNKRTSANFSTI
jgi:TRAP-type mannitol/chloroaromatic compound transport system substrate-binding protein